MLPCALEIEERWLRQEIGDLRQLLRTDNLTCSKQHCEFTKAIQSRLRAFDHDDSIHQALADGPPLKWTNSTGLYSINPRKAILATTRVVFKDALRSGGIDYEFSMHGIVSLDQLEKHRIVLVNTVKREMTVAMMDITQLSLLHELHNAGTLHYGLFHMGFRAAILIHSLDPRQQTPKEQVMAKLNALFPPIAAANLDSALPLAPYSEGLRENIRFCVYEHLMRGNTNDMTKWRALQTRLFSWCNMPGYAEARDALLRYTEEFKKIEVLCLSTLHSLECRRRSLCIPKSPAESSFMTSSSRSSAVPSPSSSFFGSDKSDFEVGIHDSSYSQASARSLSSAMRYTAQHSPLLRGMPGREISGAKTDGAAFAGDTGVAPILIYPNDLSRFEFDQHPLAKHLDMSPHELEDEPLETPRLVKDKTKRRRFGRKGSDTQTPPVPPLPPIPEALHPNLTPRNFGKIVRRIRSKSSLGTRDAEGSDRATPPPTASSELTKTPRKLKIPFRRGTRSIISSPELQVNNGSSSPFDLTSRDLASLAPSQSAPASRRQSVVSPAESAYPRAEDLEDGPVPWKVAAPRLSPMEFARSRLIQTALKRRQDDSASSDLTKGWFWTPRWEAFLVLPYKEPSSSETSAGKGLQNSVEVLNYETELISTAATEAYEPPPADTDLRSFSSCPRLSLNLGNLAIQLPSMLNLMSLDAIHPFRSLSSSTKSASPPESGEKSRSGRRFSIHAHQAEVASKLSSIRQSWQNTRIEQDHSLSPGINNIDQHSSQASGRTLTSIADNPFQGGGTMDQLASAPPEVRLFDPWQFGGHATQLSLAGSCSPPPTPVVTTAAAGPRNIGLALLEATGTTTSPSPAASSAIARKRLHLGVRPRAVGGQIVTPVEARKVGKLVAGVVGSVVSMHAQSEDFSLPDASDEERELRPPPLLLVRRQRSRRKGGDQQQQQQGLRERDTTRRNLFRSSSSNEENDLHGLLRDLGDGNRSSSSSSSNAGMLPANPFETEDRPAPWSPLLHPGSGHGPSQPETPSSRRHSLVLSQLLITPTALRLAGSPMTRQRGERGEEHLGCSPRQRKAASTYEPLPDSPTLPAVGPQVRMRRASQRPSYGSL
ncbi:hypothetical protein PWT90_06200 [Aphanocladium album]|nr:hypothetical protein PWT90_06200 [Aphanocladium album]